MNLVTILGNTNSGAGAVYEYLIGRKDTNDPFNKKEFRICVIQAGLMIYINVMNHIPFNHLTIHSQDS